MRPFALRFLLPNVSEHPRGGGSPHGCRGPRAAVGSWVGHSQCPRRGAVNTPCDVSSSFLGCAGRATEPELPHRAFSEPSHARTVRSCSPVTLALSPAFSETLGERDFSEHTVRKSTGKANFTALFAPKYPDSRSALVISDAASLCPHLACNLFLFTNQRQYLFHFVS